MTNPNILHVGFCDKFMPPFIDFVAENINNSNHNFLLRHGVASSDLICKNIVYSPKKPSFIYRFKLYALYVIEAFKADKIILHGLFNTDLIAITIIQPWIHNKCFWVIWGGDLYDYRMTKFENKSKIKERLKELLIPRLGNIITDNEGDYELAQKWYDARGKWHKCFMYPSNLYKKLPRTQISHNSINILLGNSATSTNNHIDALKKLSCYKDENIKIYCPLSYGNENYAKEIERIGEEMFGIKFISLRKFMPSNDYINFLTEIDIAIFNNNRQQAMGTIRTLLGLGKKIYLNRSTTSSKYLEKKGLKVFSFENFSLKTHFPEKENNIAIIKSSFSKKNLKNCLANIFCS